MKNNIIKTILERELKTKDMFFSFIADLTVREQKILAERKEKSLEEVGREFGITRERVRQIEASANKKIKRKKQIIDYLADKLGEYLFNEYEVEKAFNQFYKKDKLGISAIKVMWSDFVKLLWKIKQRKNE